MRLAYADPPYPGKAHLYPEKTEVDHVELIARLSSYDGWALSTDEHALRFVLALCPPDIRVLAWCKADATPYPPSPWASWEPVLLKPARTGGAGVRSYWVGNAPPRGFAARAPTIVGAKPEGFCEWLIRCLGADKHDDELDDLYPGTGVMGATWDRWRAQTEIGELEPVHESYAGGFNKLRRSHPQLPGMPAPAVTKERTAA